jgi:hypothetical protein
MSKEIHFKTPVKISLEELRKFLTSFDNLKAFDLILDEPIRL